MTMLLKCAYNVFIKKFQHTKAGSGYATNDGLAFWSRLQQ